MRRLAGLAAALAIALLVAWLGGSTPPPPSTYLRGPVGVAQAEHAFLHDGQLWLQWRELPAGDYVLQPQGEFRFADAPAAGIELKLWDTERVRSLTLKIQPL